MTKDNLWLAVKILLGLPLLFYALLPVLKPQREIWRKPTNKVEVAFLIAWGAVVCLVVLSGDLGCNGCGLSAASIKSTPETMTVTFEEFGSTHGFCDYWEFDNASLAWPANHPDRSGDNRLVAMTFLPLDSFSSGQSNEKGRQ
jgi:hypothetical protein